MHITPINATVELYLFGNSPNAALFIDAETALGNQQKNADLGG